ncbi:MAG: hypothetical protein ACI909_000714 [Planctomycetota bacterium]|jgi:hypothetical protein
MEILVYLVSSAPLFFKNHRSEVHRQSCLSGLIILALTCNYSVQASSFTFDLRTSETALALDGKGAGQLIRDGLIASLVAGPGDSIEQIFNQTSTRFGINSIGTASDSSSLIDEADGTSEKLTISFSEAILLDQIILSLFTPGEIAAVMFTDGSSDVLTGLDAAEDVYRFSNIWLGVGEPLVLTHVSGNGFSFDSFTVSTIQVSEPPIAILMILGVISLMYFRCRKC